MATSRLRALLLALAFLGGCTTVEFTPTPSAGRYPPFEGRVEVLEVFPGAASYQHLGTVSVTGRTFSNDARLIDALATEAAEHGANAIVLQGPKVQTKQTAGHTQTKMAAAAIRRE